MRTALVYDLIKWKFLISLSGVPVRFRVFYEQNVAKMEKKFGLWEYQNENENIWYGIILTAVFDTTEKT